jgi:hypothetical protein
MNKPSHSSSNFILYTSNSGEVKGNVFLEENINVKCGLSLRIK